MTKKLLVIAAVAVMLVGATRAYGYYEVWNGWFNSGYLTLDSDTFDYVEGQSTVEDTTAGSVDSFTIHAIPYRSFYCATTGYTIRLWVTGASGWKYTDQEGQKQAYNGAWSGLAILRRSGLPPVVFDTVEGTWNTTEEAGDCFNYGGRPPTYSASWVVTRSVPDGLTGGGTCSGTRSSYLPD
jgi:hypothetical protein